MRISDWSSDVCSSDLLATEPNHPTDDLEELGLTIVPTRISIIITADRNMHFRWSDREPLDHQRIINPKHINPIPQAITSVAPIDDDLIAVRQCGKHREIGSAHV